MKTVEPRKLTQAEALELLDVQPAREVVHTSKTGKLLDDEGNRIDPRCTVPWTWALGPLGSWESTVEDARADIAGHADWWLGNSLRLGVVVLKDKQGQPTPWGYAAKETA